jgi:ADP-L-glycero-D-manno-heptose 6-epimerase
MATSKTVIVTGAAGFIGRNTVAALNARGVDRLLLVDHLRQADKWKNLPGLRFDDLLPPQPFLAHLTAGDLGEIDSVIHLGACSSTTERDADYLLENNYRYTRTLCQWCMDHDVRFVYASSAATYGDGRLGFDDDRNDAGLAALRPLNMYGYSKHLFDLWASSRGLFHRSGDRAGGGVGGGIVGLKYFNVFGPHEDHKGAMRSVAATAYHQVLAEQRVKLFKSYRPDYADGQQQRDFVYVSDAVDVTLFFWEHRELAGLFNCGTGQARSWLDLANAVFAACDLPPRIEFVEMPESMRAKYQYFTQATIAKLRRAGYEKPFTPLEAAVNDYVVNYLR